jgi:hypothetical protein
MAKIDASTIEQIPLGSIDTVRFYKRDEITSDLICCEVIVGTAVRTFHEELSGWPLLMDHLEKLPSFRQDWFTMVSKPAFAASPVVAFTR